MKPFSAWLWDLLAMVSHLHAQFWWPVFEIEQANTAIDILACGTALII